MGNSCSLSLSCKFTEIQYFDAVCQQNIELVREYFQTYKDCKDEYCQQQHMSGFNTLMYAMYLNNKQLLDIAAEQLVQSTERNIQYQDEKNQHYQIPEYSSMLACAIFMKSKLIDEVIQLYSQKDIVDKIKSETVNYTALQAIVIMNDVQTFQLLKQDRVLFDKLIEVEKRKKKNAVSLAVYFNNTEMIQQFIDLKDVELLKSLNKYLDFAISPFREKLCSFDQFNKNCLKIENSIIYIQQEKTNRSKTGSNATISSDKRTKSAIYQKDSIKSIKRKSYSGTQTQ